MKKLLSLLGCVLALSAFGQDKWTDRGRTNTIGADTLFMTVYDPDGSPVNWGIEALDLAANLASLGSIPTNATLNAVSNMLYNLTLSATNVNNFWVTNSLRQSSGILFPESQATNFVAYASRSVWYAPLTNNFHLNGASDGSTGSTPTNAVEVVIYVDNVSGSSKTVSIDTGAFKVAGASSGSLAWPNGYAKITVYFHDAATLPMLTMEIFDNSGVASGGGSDLNLTNVTLYGAVAIPLVDTADGAVNIDASSGQLFYMTIEEDTVVTITNPSEDYAPTLIVTNTGAFSLTINGPGRVYEFPAQAGAVASVPVDFNFGSTNQNAQIPTQVDHVPVGNEGYLFDEIGGRMVLRPSPIMDFGWQTLVNDEFMSVISGANANWTAINLNTGIAGPNSTHIDYNHPGNTRLYVDAVGEAALYHLWLGAFNWGGENSWRIDTLVSFGATNDVGAGSSYLAQFGGANTATTNPPSQSVLFQYDPYSTKWKIVTSRTTRYTNTTDIDVITGLGQWTKLTLEGTSNTNLIASINNVPVFTNTTITEMPNSSWTPWFRNRGESGTTETSVYVDYYYMGFRPGGTRITTP